MLHSNDSYPAATELSSSHEVYKRTPYIIEKEELCSKKLGKFRTTLHV